MSTTTIHGQMSKVDEKGNVQIFHQETSASDVLVNNSTNTQGTSGASALPSGVDTLQKLTDKLAALAFKKNITTNEFAAGVVANDYTATAAGKVLDARRGKDLNDRLTQMEDEELLVIGIDTENTDLVIPESIINDAVVSGSQVWSSEKVNSLIAELLEETHVFYVPLIESSNGIWTTQTTVAEIEAAYKNNHPIWVVSSEVLLPLTQRVSQTMWIFSGYTDGKAYDIIVSSTGVTIEDKPVATMNDALPNPNVLRLTGAVTAVYDGSTEVEVEIPEVISDNTTSTNTTWSSSKITEAISEVEATASDATAAIAKHNTNNTAHSDIRDLITGLNTRLNTALNSKDVDLDQMAEIVAYIKSNRSLIEGVTTNKVNVTDIINNLTSTTTNKPLSAAQGKALKDLIDALDKELGEHTHKYAGSSTVGGSANSAVKLDSSAGSATQPVYFSNGKPVATTHTLGASVPSDAKFTDTVYNHPTYTAKSSDLYKVTVDGTGHVSATTKVTKTDITNLGIPAQDTTYNNASTSSNGLMSADDKTKLNYTNIAYGTCATDATTAEKVIMLSGNTHWSLEIGSIINVKFANSNEASNVTLNVNGTGAYPIWYNNAEYTSNSTSYTGYAGRVTTYMFDGTHYVWISNSYDSNTTYTNVKLGHGYATCTTAAATTAKTATLSSYTLTTGGIVAVRFSYDVPAGATLNINSKGAKAIYYRNAAITSGVIKAGDIATFIYSSYYRLISIDRWQEEIEDIKTDKADVSTLNTHTSNTTSHITSTERTNWNAAKTHADSAHAPSNAEKNQNAFSNITVGSTTIAADTTTDTLTLVAGSNVTITPDATNDKITIAATDTVYTHPTYTAKSSGLYKVTVDGTGHVSAASAVTKADITGLGIPAQDTVYTLPAAGSAIGGVKTGGDVTISNGVITVNDDSHAHVISNVDGLQSALDGKSPTTHKHDNDYDTKGSAATVQQNLDTVSGTLNTHTGNSDIHVTTANKTNWNAAYTHSQATHARTDATKVADSTTNGNILINGTETNVYTHPNSGVTAGTYRSVTVDAQGHITGGSNPTTLSDYGITDAESKGAAASALTAAKEYTNTKTSGLASTSSVNTSISTHNTSTSAHSDIRTLITDLTTKVNNFLDVDDTTTDQLSEVITLIENNKGTLESLTSSKVNVSDIVNNLTTSNTSKVLSAAQGVAIKSLIDALQSELDEHGHAIADVSGLQSALDGKAASSHGTHVTYSTTAPVMDGTANAGSAATVARSDHKHPTDTSRASASDLTSHTGNTTSHITSTERTNWNAAKTHADSAHAPSNAEKNQNAFSNITVGSTTIAADTATDTLTLVAGSNVTITPDATNDKVTISATDTVYTHPTYTAKSSGLYKVTVDGTGHVSDATKVTKADITGLGIPAQDTVYTLPAAGSTLGGVKTGGDVTISNGVITVNDDSHNHTIGNIDGLQTTLDTIESKLDYTNIAYCTCATDAETAEKVITISGNTHWSLDIGSIIMVSFVNTNTASNITLNVNGTGAYPIWYNNAEYTSNSSAYTGYAGRVTTFMFNGTHWVWVSNSYDANTQSNTNSTDTSSKIYLIGATTQGSSKTTYSHGEVYVDKNHHVYSNGKQTVNLSDEQALINKTYNGYTLGDACAKGVDTTATSGSNNLITSGAMYTALSEKAQVQFVVWEDND